jgi:hypothetical protein
LSDERRIHDPLGGVFMRLRLTVGVVIAGYL